MLRVWHRGKGLDGISAIRHNGGIGNPRRQSLFLVSFNAFQSMKGNSIMNNICHIILLNGTIYKVRNSEEKALADKAYLKGRYPDATVSIKEMVIS